MRIAYSASLHDCAQLQPKAFELFKNTISLCAFGKKTCEQHIRSFERQALESDVYHESQDTTSARYKRRTFGVRNEEIPGDILWYMKAVVVRQPCGQAIDGYARGVRCSDYSGKPRYCSHRLWYLRAFVVAMGGFHKAEYKLQEELLCAERNADESSCFVFCKERNEWLHVLEYSPGGVLSVETWVRMCFIVMQTLERDFHKACEQSILTLRAEVEEYWSVCGLKLRTDGNWELVENDPMNQAKTKQSQRKAKRVMEKKLSEWKHWTGDCWVQLVHKKYRECSTRNFCDPMSV